MWQYNYTNYYDDELMHYGVLGMKWGVRRAQKKLAANEKLKKKALNYDRKSATATKKSEKLHAKLDIERRNRPAVKAAKLEVKAAKVGKKAVKSDNEYVRSILERKSEKLKYKASTARLAGNRISKTTGYGRKAMKYSIKSDKFAAKAAKARMKIANNKAYEAKMQRKISTLSRAELDGAYSFIKELLTA